MELLASLDIPFYFLIHQTPAWFICVEKAPFSKSNVEKGKIILESGFGRTTAHGLLLWFAIVAIFTAMTRSIDGGRVVRGDNGLACGTS